MLGGRESVIIHGCAYSKANCEEAGAAKLPLPNKYCVHQGTECLPKSSQHVGGEIHSSKHITWSCVRLMVIMTNEGD